ncbi:heparan-alpha-glucosaminide N-acetyltransferase [Roseiflexus sp.]|uniref:heparan-alpha-glucosaminide N-acetyltransferase n=1 Tax=Roseiflexus sp. TaxID=2562120 RepID=UPI00398A6FEA
MKYRSGLHTQHIAHTADVAPPPQVPQSWSAPPLPAMFSSLLLPGAAVLTGLSALASLSAPSTSLNGALLEQGRTMQIDRSLFPAGLTQRIQDLLLVYRFSQPVDQATPKPAAGARYWELDTLRGLAISLMIGLHALMVGELATPLLAGAPTLWRAMILPICYGPMVGFHAAALWRHPGLGIRDLDEQAQQQPALKAALLAGYAAVATVVLSAVQALGMVAEAFMGIAGLSLAVSHQRLKARGLSRWKRIRHHLARGAGLFALGMGLTAFTWLLFPDQFIIFGILHLLGSSVMLAAPFLELPPWVSIVTGFGILAAGVWITPHMPALGPWAIPFGFGPPSRAMLDYFPIFPWSGMLLLHTGIGRLIYHEDGRRAFSLPDLSQTRPVQALSGIGRNSLRVYLVQSPFTFGGMGALS